MLSPQVLTAQPHGQVQSEHVRRTVLLIGHDVSSFELNPNVLESELILSPARDGGDVCDEQAHALGYKLEYWDVA